MSSRSDVAVLLVPLAALAALAATRGPAVGAGSRMLRVCADPNNLPFSNARGEGFENRIAAVVARELHEPVTYHWWPERRGFVRTTLNANLCDVVIGVPAGYPLTLNTAPYYRSTYALVSRASRHYGLRSLDDPRLAHLRLGVHFLGGKAVPPPVIALNVRHVAANVTPYSIFGDYRTPNPPAALIAAVAADDVDVAIAWGPLAGYFARRAPVALDVVPLPAGSGAPGRPLDFAIAMGVRRGDTALRDAMQRVLDRRGPEIRHILDAYAVPRLADGTTPSTTPNGRRAE